MPLSFFLSLLTLFGLNTFMVLSLTPELLPKQLLSWAIGIGLFLAGRLISPKNTAPSRWLFFVFGSLFLFAPILLNHITRGSRRWIDIGPLTIQPSEIAKPFFILFLVTTGQPFWLLIPALIIMAQPDLGSALSYLALTVPTFLGQPKLAKIAAIFLIACLTASPFLWKYGLHDYQRNRIVYFLEPQKDPLNKGYNVIQSTIAVGAGGLTGRGFKQGSQGQLKFLPEKQTDFMFASLAEEIGLVGIVTLLVAYFFLFRALLQKAFSTSDTALSLFTLSVVTQIWFQAFVNIGMNIGILPVTGIPLPFISYGGSSLMSLLFSLGIIYSS
ncbi:rod shape-determining protein RodA [Patescibacteria group bacterium]|nr:rod shape-determining protein RodA [Patescibacteria group bacterium]